jgi:hypothetical protein
MVRSCALDVCHYCESFVKRTINIDNTTGYSAGVVVCDTKLELPPAKVGGSLEKRQQEQRAMEVVR